MTELWGSMTVRFEFFPSMTPFAKVENMRLVSEKDFPLQLFQMKRVLWDFRASGFIQAYRRSRTNGEARVFHTTMGKEDFFMLLWGYRYNWGSFYNETVGMGGRGDW